MLTVPIFRPWRAFWDTALSSLTPRLDELAGERKKGRGSPPQVSAEALRCVGSDHVQALLHDGHQPAVKEFLRVMQELQPVLRAAVWPRWLLLEAALEEASVSGALHLGALVLRTQIEELDALRAVAPILAPTPETSWDEGMIAAASQTLSKRVLPRLQTKTSEELLQAAGDPSHAARRPERLQKVFDELGDYVHPNYGSHVLSVQPHSVEAASVLVGAFVAVYETFLALPWAREADDQPAVSIPRQWRPPFLVLAEDTARVLAAHPAPAEIGAVPWIDAINCFHWRWENQRTQEKMARSLESGDVPGEKQNLDVGAIRALREQGVPTDAWPVPIASTAKRSRYAFLVEDERRLVVDAERLGAIPGRHDDASWLSLLCSALTFSINVTEFKLDTLAEQAARLINAENVLGAALVVRSMLEHHAVAVELGKKLRDLWNRIERAAPSKEQISTVLSEAEKQIARALAGTSGSRERSAAWRTLWQHTVRTHYNVLDPIRAIDADQPGFLRTYGLLSHIVHGAVCTGGDLLGTRQAGARPGQPTLAQLVLFLANLCTPDAMMDRQAESMDIADRLAVTRRDVASGLGRRVAAMRLLEGQKLKPGRDIFGCGTANDPFRFRRGLLYHDAYYYWLKQEGIQVRNCRVEQFGGGIGDRIETEDGRVLYILNDQSTSA